MLNARMPAQGTSIHSVSTACGLCAHRVWLQAAMHTHDRLLGIFLCFCKHKKMHEAPCIPVIILAGDIFIPITHPLHCVSPLHLLSGP